MIVGAYCLIRVIYRRIDPRKIYCNPNDLTRGCGTSNSSCASFLRWLILQKYTIHVNCEIYLMVYLMTKSKVVTQFCINLKLLTFFAYCKSTILSASRIPLKYAPCTVEKYSTSVCSPAKKSWSFSSSARSSKCRISVPTAVNE